VSGPLSGASAKIQPGAGFFFALSGLFQNRVKPFLYIIVSHIMYYVNMEMYTVSMESVKKTTIDFSRNLKRLRKQKGLSQYDLADLTGFSQRMIAHYETHAIQPSLDKIEAIAKALGVKPAELLASDTPNSDEIDASMFDTRSLKKLQDILSLPQNDRADLYRMLNRMLRENRNKQETKKESNTI